MIARRRRPVKGTAFPAKAECALGRRIFFALLALGAGPALAAESSAFPQGDSLFAPILADPRRVQSGVLFYMLNGQLAADVALGRSWGMERWTSGDWSWQWDVEGMAYSRLFITGTPRHVPDDRFLRETPA